MQKQYESHFRKRRKLSDSRTPVAADSLTHHISHTDRTEAVDFIDHDQSTLFGTCDVKAFGLKGHVESKLLEQRRVVRHGVVCMDILARLSELTAQACVCREQSLGVWDGSGGSQKTSFCFCRIEMFI